MTRFALLLLAALLCLLPVAGAVAFGQDPSLDAAPLGLPRPEQPAPAPNPLVEQLVALLATLLAAALAAAMSFARGWLNQRLANRVLIEGVEVGGDAATKQAIKAKAEVAGVQPALDKAVQRATTRLSPGGVQ